MKSLTLKQVKSIIKKYDLQLGISREISFFLTYCLARGYTTEMIKRFGFSYRAIAIKGYNNKFTDYLNIIRLSEEIDKFLERYPGNKLEEVLDSVINEFKKIEEIAKQAKGYISKDPFRTLKMISDFATLYFCLIGFYNVFWRYLAVGKNLSEKVIRRISRERDLMANLYPKLDNNLLKCGKIIGSRLGFDGDLIRSFTLGEMRQFIKSKKISRRRLDELAKRRSHYFYLFTEDSEEALFVDPATIEDICNSCFPEEVIPKLTELHGQGAYPGRVRGKVYHLIDSKVRPPKNFILVTHMTHPKDIMLINKSLAVVTDEGSILCHAAVACRELKKPCIVGTKIATKVLKDGDWVEVDAEKGVVRKI